MTIEEIKQILDRHRAWRNGETGGARADLAGANLEGANLEGADLAGANLADAYLGDANLGDANLGDADLTGAYLTGANLAGADLTGAYLRGAYLRGAYLGGADLAGANLEDANLGGADLTGAYLTGANLEGANLEGANLGGANLADAYLGDANLGDANLGDARGLPDGPQQDPPEPYVRATTPRDYSARAERYRQRHPEVPVVEALDRKILELIESGKGQLEMGRWHTCETTHCRAGWAITLAGEAGHTLEKKYGPHHAGMMIYRVSTGRVPHFFASNSAALNDIRARAAEQKATEASP